MKRQRNYFLFLSLLLVGPFLLSFSQKQSLSTTPNFDSIDKKLKALFSKMIFVEEDTFVMGQMSTWDIRLRESDSTLLALVTPRRAVANSFYISATEVTNSEWRAFYQDKVVELGKKNAKRQYYPDTTLWISEFPYSYNAPMAENYFSHPNFNNFPVVGITWDQANAYCQWKTKELKILLEKKGIKSSAEFRLPTEKEWESAASTKNKTLKLTNRHFYPWSPKYNVLQINELANIGQIFDYNNFVLKAYQDDGALYTAEIASYPPNYLGIYDLAGNVSEWTSDQGYFWSFQNKISTEKSLIHLNEDALKAELEYIKTQLKLDDQELKPYAEGLRHNQEILNPGDTKICKGGSWADGVIYTQVGSRQGVRKDNASTKIGFRLALSSVDQELIKYFPKKTWKP